MTCKDCVHYEVCKKHYNEENSALPDLFDLWLRPEICSDFKNKADFVEVKRGEWFVDEFPKQGKKFIICSECRSVIDCNVTYVDENEYDYCPYCGADMRKEGADK
jgi:hypothetical protein